MFVPLALTSGALILFRSTISEFYGQDSIVREEFFTLSNLESRLISAEAVIEQAEPVNDPEAEARFQTLSDAVSLNYRQAMQLNSHLSEKQRMLQASLTKWQQAKVIAALMFDDSVTRAQREQAQLDVQHRLRQSVQHTRTLKASLQSWLLDDNHKRAKHLETQVWMITVLLIVLALSILVTFSILLSRWVFQPLTKLEAGVMRFGLGELGHRIDLDNTKDELGQLAEAFNLMAEQLTRSQQKLERLATLDGLTGVYNRREFNRWLTVAVERADREQQPVSLVMVDIDHFKKLNDTYGHQTGDEALRCVAQRLSATVRPGDLIARYGGEEFAVILPSTENGEALAIAERIRTAIADSPIAIMAGQTASAPSENGHLALRPTQPAEPLTITEAAVEVSHRQQVALAEPLPQTVAEYPTDAQSSFKIRVTASLGLASFPMDAGSEETLLSAADQALYDAKENGRNQVHQARSILS